MFATDFSATFQLKIDADAKRVWFLIIYFSFHLMQHLLKSSAVINDAGDITKKTGKRKY